MEEGSNAWPMDEDLNEHSALISEYDPYTGSFGAKHGSAKKTPADAMKCALMTFTALVVMISAVFVTLLLLHGGEKHREYSKYNSRFAELVDRELIRTTLQASSSTAHHAGSQEEKATAEEV